MTQRRWVVGATLALSVLAVGAAWWLGSAPSAPPGPTVSIFVQIDAAAPANAAPTDGQIRAGDALKVTVRGEAGTHLTLLLLESADRLVLPSRAVNHPLPGDGLWQSTFTVDDQPGREQFMALVTRAPLPDPGALLAAVNEAPDRAARAKALPARLAALLPAGAFTLEVAREVEHVR